MNFNQQFRSSPFWCFPKKLLYHTGKQHFILVMKLTILLMTTLLLQVSAGTKAQVITLKRQNATLKSIFEEIGKQSGFTVLYQTEQISKSKLVTLNLNQVSLETAVRTILEEQDLDFNIEDRAIVIKRKKKTILDKIEAYLSNLTINARIIDPEGKGLAGASIKVKNTSVGTLSDRDGYFSLRNLSENAEIVVSFIGFQTQEITANPKLKSITLKRSDSKLDELQVIAYGQTTRRFSTGNVSTVTAADIARQPVTNVLQALQGTVPGLIVNQTSGFASAPYSVEIRGKNNLYWNPDYNVSDPLYVIDGVPITMGNGDANNRGINQNNMTGPSGGQSPIYSINPADIESISVLKDADATAIYGARAVNGVILITTKKGRPGKTTVDLNLYTGLSLQTRKLHLMNTQQYLDMRREAFKNDGIDPDDGNAYDLTIWDNNRYTDWQKVFLGTAHTNDAQLGISGGDNTTTYRLNGGYHRETPPFPGDFSDQRSTVALSLNHSTPNDRFNLSTRINYANTTSNLPSYDASSLIFLAPNAPAIYDENGNFNFEGWKAGSFPRTMLSLKQPYKTNTDYLTTNVGLNYRICNGFNFHTSLGYSFTYQNQNSLSPLSSQNPEDSPSAKSVFGNNQSKTWIIEPNLTYNKTIGKAALQALFGGTLQNNLQSGSTIYADGFLSDELLEDLSAARELRTQTNYAQTRFQSLYLRLNYNYQKKYILNLNGRRDGSSRFGPSKQFGNFGSVGAAWIASEEQFLKNNLPIFSFIKLRTSYGITGGDGIGDYEYLSTLYSSANPYQNSGSLILSRLANTDFSWTVNKKLEAAIDLGIHKDQFMFSFAWYRNRSGNQLVGYTLPSITGFNSVNANLPAVVQNTGIEITLLSKNISKKDFNWNTSFNISIPRNKLLDFPNLAISSYNTIYAIGEPLYRKSMYHYLGMDSDKGIYLIADKNNDGKFNSLDYLYERAGPKFIGGLQNNIDYKGFSLSFLFSFARQKGPLGLNYNTPGALNYGMNNQTTAVLDRWQKPGDQSNRARFTTDDYADDIYRYTFSDGVWVDASYIRLQNLSLAYALPSRWIKGAALSACRVYIQGQNIFTITNYEGSDPASPSESITLPPRKFFTAGLQLTF